MHRLGRTRPVTAVRLLCECMVPVRILEMQQCKLPVSRPTPDEAR